jgi:PadR family transcriptional regulator, regulatory protein AphA
MAKKEKTRYALLGALSVFPMSGYDLKKWITECTGPFWAESSGRIYPCLKELLKEKLVVCDESKGQGKRQRKLYKITAAGLKVLKTWLLEPAEQPVLRNEFRLKIFYGKQLSKADLLKHIKRQQDKMQKDLARLTDIETHIKTDHKNDGDAYYWLLTLRSAIHHCRAEHAWCEEMLTKLRSKK